MIVTHDPPSPPSIGDVGRLADEGRSLFLDAARAQRVYEPARDRRLGPAQARGVVLRLVDDARGLVRAVTESLVAGKVRLGSWFGAMRSTLLPRHFAAGYAVLGAHPDLPPADLDAIAGLSRGQVGYLERFRGQVATAAQILDGTAVARAAMYADALWSLGMGVERRKMIRDGYSEELNNLGSLDHCGMCLDAASAGWSGIGTLPEIGDRTCRQGCRCWWSYR